MKLIFCIYAVTVVALLDCSAALTTQTNSSRKLEVGANSNPQVFGVAFDEIVVESNLNIRGKSPSSRSQRTQLFPVSKSNITKASPSNENIKLANV